MRRPDLRPSHPFERSQRFCSHVFLFFFFVGWVSCKDGREGITTNLGKRKARANPLATAHEGFLSDTPFTENPCFHLLKLFFPVGFKGERFHSPYILSYFSRGPELVKHMAWKAPRVGSGTPISAYRNAQLKGFPGSVCFSHTI